jgi:hypothetical protein
MANELTYHSAANTGDTLYAHVENMVGQLWNGAAFEDPVSANWADYDIAMAEQATSTGIFRATLPAGAAAEAYSFVVRKQAGGSPAVADIVLGSGRLDNDVFDDGVVWVNSAGTNSTAWPYGSACHPTSTIANGKVIADANSINKIHVKGSHTFAAAMEGYNFIGGLLLDASEILSLNGQSVKNSSFRDCVITGAMGNVAGIGNQTTFTDCYLYVCTNIQGWIYNGRVDGACSLVDLGYATFHNTLFGSGVACTLTLQAAVACDIENMAGELTLSGMDGGACSVSMSRGSILTVDVTCTAGTITVTGAGTVVDNSSVGCTVSVQVAEADTVKITGTGPATVKAQVVAALATDTYAEPGQGAPAATASLKDKISYLYKNWRNKKTQDATTFELYNDAAAVVDQKAQ